jgi:hypothetical protein
MEILRTRSGNFNLKDSITIWNDSSIPL